MSGKILRNICRDTTTSAIWNVTERPCLTIFAPVLISFSRSVVSDQCSTSYGSTDFCLWLHSDIPWGTPERLLLPRKPTFEGQRPLSHRFRLLYTREQTFTRSPPDFCS